MGVEVVGTAVLQCKRLISTRLVLQRTAERKPYVGAAVVGVAVGARVGAKLAVVQHTLDLSPLQKPYLKLVLQKLESLALKGSMQTPGCP